MKLPSPRAWWPAIVFALLLSACATPPRPSGPVDAQLGPWAGRLALFVTDKPEASFSAAFELKGNAKQGELALYSPLGGTLGVLVWEPGKAVLRSGSKDTQFDSVAALAERVAGAPIPITALFDWLRGIATPVPGWQPDLSQLGQGRITAKRFDPPPQADLRVVLER